MLSLFTNIFGAFKTWIIVGILISLMCGAAYFYYSSTQATISKLIGQNAQLEANNKQLVTANNENLKTIDTLQQSYAKIQNDYQQSQEDFQKIRTQNKNILNSIMNSNTGTLAYTDTTNTEAAINKYTADSNRCLEILSGSPLTEVEKNAKTDTEFNISCPWLFPNTVKH